MLETLEELVTGLVERSKTTREQSDDPEAEFAEINEYVLKQMQEIVPLLGVALFTEQAAGRTLYQERIHPLLEEWTRLSERSLGRLPQERTLDADFIFKAFFGMMFMFTLDSLFRDTELDVERVADNVKELMLHGITAQAPPAKRTRAPRKK